MSWSDRAREAAAEARRMHAKGGKPHAQLARLVVKVGNQYPTAMQMKRNYRQAKVYAADPKMKAVVMGGLSARAYTYKQSIDALKAQVSLKKFK